MFNLPFLSVLYSILNTNFIVKQRDRTFPLYSNPDIMCDHVKGQLTIAWVFPSRISCLPTLINGLPFISTCIPQNQRMAACNASALTCDVKIASALTKAAKNASVVREMRNIWMEGLKARGKCRVHPRSSPIEIQLSGCCEVQVQLQIQALVLVHVRTNTSKST